MLTLFTLFSAPSLSLSIPIAVHNTENVNMQAVTFDHRLPECMNVARYRTVQEVILSCFATIFACTWVAIHPNLPGPRDSGRTKLKRKVVAATYAVLAPEFLAMWALRQWIAARNIVSVFNVKHREAVAPTPVPWYITFLRAPKMCWTVLSAAAVEWWRGSEQDPPSTWTLTHGFFVQMGGFMLCEGNRPIRVLTFDDLMMMVKEGHVEVPDVTEKDINDKSKGDFLTKLVVVLQMTWFLFQCLARWAVDLPVTELEVATLAFAVLNIVTYGLWWKKPQSIEVAVRVQLKPRVANVADRNSKSEQTSETRRMLEGDVGYEKESAITRDLRYAVSDGWTGRVFGVLYALFAALCRPVAKMVCDNDWKVYPSLLRMPMFYADRFESHDLIPIMGIAVLFGCFHLIPWSSTFLSAAELWLWRSSALLIAAHPLLLILSLVAEYRSRPIYVAAGVAYTTTLPLYYLARLTLLVLAFTTLRALPGEAYEWTIFIPHL